MRAVTVIPKAQRLADESRLPSDEVAVLGVWVKSQAHVCTFMERTEEVPADSTEIMIEA